MRFSWPFWNEVSSNKSKITADCCVLYFFDLVWMRQMERVIKNSRPGYYRQHSHNILIVCTLKFEDEKFHLGV